MVISGFVPVRSLRRKSLFLQGLTIILCGTLAVPAPLFAALQDGPNPTPAAATQTATAAVDTRANIRRASHLAAWKLAYLINHHIPGYKKLKLGEYYQLYGAYEHCDSPFKSLPTNLTEFDNTVLAPYHETLSQFLTEHRDDFGEQEEDYDINTGGESVEFIEGDNGFRCEPKVGRTEVSTLTHNAESVRQMSDMVKKAAGGMPAPFYQLLRSKKAQPIVSNPELRLWVAWAHAIRQGRGTFAKYLRLKNGKADPTPLPELVVPWHVGDRLQKTFVAEIDRRSTRHNPANPNEKLKTPEQAAKFPKFAPCLATDKLDPEKDWCLFDLAENPVFSLDEDIVFEMGGKDSSHGKKLNALRKTAIKTLLTELATVNFLLQDQAKPLPNACSATTSEGNADMAPFADYYSLLSKFDPKQVWAAQFQSAVAGLVNEYELGRREIPVPQSDAFYTTADGMILELVRTYFEKNTLTPPARKEEVKVEAEAAPEPTANDEKAEVGDESNEATTQEEKDAAATTEKTPEEVEAELEKLAAEDKARFEQEQTEAKARATEYTALKRDALVGQFEKFPLKSRLIEGDSQFGKGSYAALLAEKLFVWYATYQEELGTWDEVSRKEEITASLKDAVALALSEVAEVYLVSTLAQDQLGVEQLRQNWRKTYAPKWRRFLESEAMAAEIARIAHLITEGLFAQRSATAKYDAKDIADSTISQYVRKAESKVSPAVQAEDTIRYMNQLAAKKSSTLNLAPNPYSLAWQMKKASQAANFDGSEPAYCHVDDGFLHGYGDPSGLPDGRETADFTHFKEPLFAIAERRRDALIESLKKMGYSDVNCQEMFGSTEVGGQKVPRVRNVGALADLVLAKFREVGEATTTSDRGRLAVQERGIWLPLEIWLQSAEAPRVYRESTRLYAKAIYDTYFRALFEIQPDGKDAAQLTEWSRRVVQMAETVEQNETYLKKVDAQAMVDAHGKKAAIDAMISTGYAETRAQMKQLFQSAQDADLMEMASPDASAREKGEKAWQALCSDKSKCQAWYQTMTAPLSQTAAVEGLYAWRVKSNSSLLLKQFLKHFGAQGSLYSGSGDPVADKNTPFMQHRTRLEELKKVRGRFIKSWFGELLGEAEGGATNERELKENKINSFLGRASQQAHEKLAVGEKEDQLIEQLINELEQVIPDLYADWKRAIDIRLATIRKAIDTGDINDIRAAAEPVRILFALEYNSPDCMQGPSKLIISLTGGSYSGEGRFIEQLRGILFPDFSSFRSAIDNRLRVVKSAHANPQEEMDAARKEIDRLTTEKHVIEQNRVRRSFVQSLADFGNWGVPVSETAEFKNLERDLRFAEERYRTAERNHRDHTELARLVRNYLSHLPETVELTRLAETEKNHKPMWDLFFDREFLFSETDAVGNLMALRPAEVLADLNSVSLLADQSHLATGTTASQFLKEVLDYCRAGLTPAHHDKFVTAFQTPIDADIKALTSTAAAEALKTDQPLPFDAQMAKIRLTRLFQLKKHSADDNWIPALETEENNGADAKAVLQAAQEGRLNQELPALNEVCQWIERQSTSLLPLAEARKTEEQAQYSHKRKELSAAPRAYQRAKEAELKAAVKEAHLVAAKPFTTGLNYARYWNVVQVISDVFLGPKSEFSPLHNLDEKNDTSGAGTFIYHSPATRIEGAGGNFLPMLSLDATQSILNIEATTRFLGAWRKVIGQDNGWLNGLGTNAQFELFFKIKSELESVVEAKDANKRLQELGHFKDGPIAKATSYDAWHRMFRGYLLFWDVLKGKFRAETSAFKLFEHQLTAPLARVIFREFVSFTDYRLSDGHVRLSAEPSTVESQLTLFDSLTDEAKRQAIEDIESLYVTEEKNLVALFNPYQSTGGSQLPGLANANLTSETSGLFRPFEPQYLKNRKPPQAASAATVPASAVENYLAFYTEHFVTDLAEEQQPETKRTEAESQYDAPAIDTWLTYAQGQLANGQRIDSGKRRQFSWNGSLTDGTSRETERFDIWFESLSTNPEAAELFTKVRAREQELRATAKREGHELAFTARKSKRLWEIYSDLHAFKNAEGKDALYAQLRGLMLTADSNQPNRFEPKSYSFFLAHLAFNKHYYARKPVIGRTLSPRAPHDQHLAYLMDLIVQDLEIDRKSVQNWTAPFRKFPDPTDRLAVATSQRNLLVGVGEGRFLGTKVNAPYVASPYWLKAGGWTAADYTYRPAVVADKMERIDLGSSLDYADYRKRLEDPVYLQPYRLGGDDANHRPLFAQMQMSQVEMHGERDLMEQQEAGKNPLEHRRFKDRMGRWAEVTFGNTLMNPNRAKAIAQAAKAAELNTSVQEVTDLAQIREGLVDFRKTVSELNLAYAFESYQVLGGEQDPIDPNLRGWDRFTAGAGQLVKQMLPHKGSRVLQRWHFGGEVFAALKQFAAQMGAQSDYHALSEEIAKREAWWKQAITTENGDLATIAAAREENIAFALYHAGQFAKKRLHRTATSDEEKIRLQKIVALIDDTYTLAMQTFDTRQGLRKIAENAANHLNRLCSLRSLETIGDSDDEMRAAETLIRDEARLTAFDGLSQLLFVDSGIVDNSNPVGNTHRLLQELTRKQSHHQEALHDVETVVNWLFLGVIATSVAGHLNPGISQMILRHGISRSLFTLLNYSLIGGFSYTWGNSIFDEFVSRPSELSLLESIRDTQFASVALMKDESAGLVASTRRALEMENRLTATNAVSFSFKWLFQSFGFLATVQTLSGLWQVTKWGLGGSRQVLRNFGWWAPAESQASARLARAARTIGMTPAEGTAFQELARTSPSEAQERLLWQYENAMNARRDMSGRILPDARSTEHLKTEVEKQISQLSSSLKLNRQTLLPNLTQELPATKAVQQARVANEKYIEALQRIRTHLNSVEGASIAVDDLRFLLVNAADHTPWYRAVLGLPFKYQNATTRHIGKLRELVQAELDILAIHDPQFFAYVIRLNSGVRSADQIRPQDLFESRGSRDFTEIPEDVLRLYQDLMGQAREVALNRLDDEMKAIRDLGEDSGELLLKEFEGSGRAKEFYKAQVRDAFYDVFNAAHTDASRQALVEAFAPKVSQLANEHYFSRLLIYRDYFLSEHMLIPQLAAREKIELLRALDMWRAQSENLVRQYARGKGVTDDQVLQWMLDPKHPDFSPRSGKAKPVGEDSSVATATLPNASDNQQTIRDAAATLRQLVRKGDLPMNRDFIRALHQGDYAALSREIIRRAEFAIGNTAGPYSGGAAQRGAGAAPNEPQGEGMSEKWRESLDEGLTSDEWRRSLVSDADYATQLKAEQAAPRGGRSSTQALDNLSDAELAKRAKALGTVAERRAAQRAAEMAKNPTAKAKPSAEAVIAANEKAAQSSAVLEFVATGKLPEELVPSLSNPGDFLRAPDSYLLYQDLRDRLLQVIPENARHLFSLIMDQGGTSQALQRFLAMYRIRFGTLGVADEHLVALKLAIGHTEALELLAQVSPSVKDEVGAWLIRNHLQYAEKILHSNMSTAEAMEIFGLTGKALPKSIDELNRLHLTHTLRTGSGPLVTEAQRVLTTKIATGGGIQSIEDMAQTLGVPSEFFSNQHLRRALTEASQTGFGGSAEQQAAKRMVEALFGKSAPTAEWSSATERWIAEAVADGDNLSILRRGQFLAKLEANLKARVEKAEAALAPGSRPTQAHLGEREALRRIGIARSHVKAEPVLSEPFGNFTDYPRWWIGPEQLEGFSFQTNTWFAQMARTYKISPALVQRAETVGLINYRHSLLKLEMEGIEGLANVTVKEEAYLLSRLMHATVILEGAERAGLLANPKVAELFQRLLEVRYVFGPPTKITLLKSEAKAIQQHVKTLIERNQLTAELRDYLAPRVNEARLVSDLTQPKLEGLETFVLRSYSETPMEVMVALNREMIARPDMADDLYELSSFLLDGPSEMAGGKWFNYSRQLPSGEKRVVRHNRSAELFRGTFGDTMNWQPDTAFAKEFEKGLRQQIENQLRMRSHWEAEAIHQGLANEQMLQSLEDAIQRFQLDTGGTQFGPIRPEPKFPNAAEVKGSSSPDSPGAQSSR